ATATMNSSRAARSFSSSRGIVCPSNRAPTNRGSTSGFFIKFPSTERVLVCIAFIRDRRNTYVRARHLKTPRVPQLQLLGIPHQQHTCMDGDICNFDHLILMQR